MQENYSLYTGFIFINLLTILITLRRYLGISLLTHLAHLKVLILLNEVFYNIL